MEQLCRQINMPGEVTAVLAGIHQTLEYYPCLELLMQEETWNTGLEQLKEAVGDDPDGMKRLCCMLRCALRTKEIYARKGIPERIYTDTMAAFSRFVREDRNSYGCYKFTRTFWTTRQVSGKLFRIGQLEYEMTVKHGQPAVSLHIPTDVDLRPEVLVPSLRDGLATFCRFFPEYEGKKVYCHSWLMSPLLKDFLPEDSNILRFQKLFDITADTVPGNDILLWVFKNPRLPKEDYPENTSLQRKLKQFFLSGGAFLEGTGYLNVTGMKKGFTMDRTKLLARMTGIISDPEHPLMAAAVGVVRAGRILFSDAVGKKYLDGTKADGDTKYRIASISKLITAVGVWQLIEQGLVDPDADASGYVGFPLRNPNHPDTPITVRMLMSHTSSIRDGGVPGSYNIPYGHHICEFFTEGAAHYMPRCWAPAEEAPGKYFAYCNMNYCLLGSVVENVSGQRFDLYMTDHIFSPMGLSCSYNVSAMPEDVRSQVGTIYRKLDEAGRNDPVNGTWTAQCDDFTVGYPHDDYAGYAIGTNGSLFGPMGSLRISIRELCELMLMFCNGGSYRGIRILKPETLDRMFTPVWTYDPAACNGDTCGNSMFCYGMGPQILLNGAGDRAVQDQDLPFAGHSAAAYGLFGGMFFDRKGGNGLIYIAAGTGSDWDQYPGTYSSFYGWEEKLLTAAAEFAQFDY